MSLDRFIYWNRGKAPSRKEVRKALVEYLGSGGDVTCNEEYSSQRLFATLRDEERWFEVFFHEEDSIDVITRNADEFTSAVAEKFAEILARRWNGCRHE